MRADDDCAHFVHMFCSRLSERIFKHVEPQVDQLYECMFAFDVTQTKLENTLQDASPSYPLVYSFLFLACFLIYFNATSLACSYWGASCRLCAGMQAPCHKGEQCNARLLPVTHQGG